MKSDIPIKSIQRRYKYVSGENNTTKKVPRQQIIVTFDKLEIPKYVFLYRLRHEVEVWYAPVSQCFNCFNYGHTAKQCKGKNAVKIAPK